MAEGGKEHPQRGRVEQPVGCRPTHRPPRQGPVLQQGRAPGRQPLHQGGGAVRVEEPDPSGDPADHPAGPLLAPGQQVEQPPEGAQQDDPHTGGHNHQNRAGRLSMPPGRDVEAVGHQKGHQAHPEHHVEHHGRPDPLGTQGEPGIGSGHARLGQEPVAESRPGGVPAGGDVAEGECGHVDPEQPEPGGPSGREDGMGQLGVRRQGGDLQQQTQDQIGHIDVGQGVDLAPVGGRQRQGHVEDEQEDHQRAHAEPDLTTDEGPPVPPSTVVPPTVVCRIGRHLLHVGTPGPHGPDMLTVWWNRPRASTVPIRRFRPAPNRPQRATDPRCR